MNGFTWAVILVACLAVGANADADADGFPASVTRDDVQQLNKYLRAKPHVNGTDGDLALIERDVDLLEGGAKRAGQAILALSKLKECNQDVIGFFDQVEASAMDKFNYDQRARLLSYKLVGKAAKLCFNYIQKFLLDKHRQLASNEESVAKLFEVLRQRHEMFGYNFITHPGRTMRIFVDLPVLGRLLPKDSAPIAANRDQFDRLFDEKIVKPCEMYNNVLAEASRRSKMIANMGGFLNDTSDLFKSVLLTHKSCEQLVSIDSQDKSEMFQNMMQN